jgi:hypothetical protein
MLAILTAAVLGYWANQHIGFERSEDASISLRVDAAAIAADVRWLWLAFLSVCAFAIGTARNARRFVDTVVRPWLSLVGLHLPELPTLPMLSAAPNP